MQKHTSRIKNSASLDASKGNTLFNSPVVQNNVSWYLTGEIGEESEYLNEIHTMRSLEEGDRMTIYLNNTGGLLSGAIGIIQAMHESKAEIVVVITGECHSAASMIALSAPAVQVEKFACMMLHDAQGGCSGTLSNNKISADFNRRYVEKIMRSTYAGFISEEEMQRLLLGAEIWLDAEEIEQRLLQRLEMQEALQEAEDAKNAVVGAEDTDEWIIE